MIDNMELPKLKSFPEVVNLYNLKKLFQFLLFFAKNQYILVQSQQSKLTSHLGPSNFPTYEDRQYLINFLLDAFTQSNNAVQIIGAQRMISGLIMLGHIHIYEIMIRQIFPTFIHIIRDKPQESKINKFHQSVLKVEGGELPFAQKKRKIRQFCKQTLVLLSIWFPKDFYDQMAPSWFKNIIEKEEIQCQFFVYYTADKINQYEEMLKTLKLDVWEAECFECIRCIQTRGSSYDYLKKVQTFSSLLVKDSKLQNEEGEKFQIPYMKNLLKNKIEKKIKRKKTQGLQNQISSSETGSNNRESSLFQVQSNTKLTSIFSPEQRTKDNSGPKKSKSHVNLKDLRNKIRQKRKNKETIEKASKNEKNTSQKILQLQSKNYLENKSVFGTQFQKLGEIEKNFFRKECLKKKKKIMSYHEGGATIEIHSRVKGKFLELKLTGFSIHSEKVSVKLVSPTNEQYFVKKRLSTYTFKFIDAFMPIVFKINDKQFIIPVCRIDQLEKLSDEDEFFSVQEESLQIVIDKELFKSVEHISNLLGLEKQSRKYVGLFRCGEESYKITLRQMKSSSQIVKLSCETSSNSKTVLFEILEEINQCISKKVI